MKKILSTILTFTMFLLPLTVQCSANSQCYTDYNGNYVVEIQNNEEKNTSSTTQKSKNFLSRLFEKSVRLTTEYIARAKINLITIAILGSIAALCKWSPNGELTKNINEKTRKLYNKAISPLFKSAQNKLSNICLRKSKDEGKCEKTFGQWFDEKKDKAVLDWQLFKCLPLIGDKNIVDIFNVIVTNFKFLFSTDPIEEQQV